MKLSLLF